MAENREEDDDWRVLGELRRLLSSPLAPTTLPMVATRWLHAVKIGFWEEEAGARGRRENFFFFIFVDSAEPAISALFKQNTMPFTIMPFPIKF